MIEFEKGYFIFNDGRVFSERSNKFLTPVKNSKNYLRICTPLKRYFIHRLVATYFVPNPTDKPQVNHKDGNKHNNHYTNLEWVTNKENRKHAIDNGLHKVARGINTGSNKLSENDVRYIRKNYVKGQGGNLARQFNVSVPTILNIVNRKKWTHLVD